MKNNFNIDEYLRQAESEFSGANGQEWEFDEVSNFDNNTELDLSFEGNNLGGANKQPTPYQVSITNSTAGTLTAVLFGMNQYLLTTNFGTATGVTVTPSQTNVSYLELLQQSANQPFETSLIRIQSSNTSQVTQIITISSKDANGQQVTIPLITQSYFSANQFQGTIVDIPYAVKIDGNSTLSFPVLATTTVIVTLFPSEKANLSRQLNGASVLQQYSNPSVPIATMPVYLSPRASRGKMLGK